MAVARLKRLQQLVIRDESAPAGTPPPAVGGRFTSQLLLLAAVESSGRPDAALRLGAQLKSRAAAQTYRVAEKRGCEDAAWELSYYICMCYSRVDRKSVV